LQRNPCSLLLSCKYIDYEVYYRALVTSATKYSQVFGLPGNWRQYIDHLNVKCKGSKIFSVSGRLYEVELSPVPSALCAGSCSSFELWVMIC